MKTKQLRIAFLLGLVITLLFLGSAYSQQSDVDKYPNRPITFIVSTLAGGSTDLAFRLVTKEAETFLGQPIVVLNKSGGAHSLALGTLATSKPDGYTLGYGSHSGLFVTPFLQKVNYDPLKDFRYIIQFGMLNFGVTVKANSPIKDWKDLIAYARQNPKKLTYAVGGANTMHDFLMEQIGIQEKVEFTSMPFRSSPECQAAILGGHVQAWIGDFPYSLVQAGELRVLLLLRETRDPQFSQTPILKDFGYNIPFPGMLNILSPKGIPDGIARKLEDAFTKVMKQPAFTKGMENLQYPIVYRNGKELTDYVAQNYGVWQKILKEKGLIK